MYGSTNSYLYVDTDNMNINNLPEACVSDSQARYNILPIGQCVMGGHCSAMMKIEEDWYNPKPQTKKVNGKEAITTDYWKRSSRNGYEAKEEEGSSSIPDKAKEIARQVKERNGAPPQGYKGGKVYRNMPKEGAQKLPKGIEYKEYDINPYVKGQNRGTERIIIGDDGSVWYTNNHYETFTKIK